MIIQQIFRALWVIRTIPGTQYHRFNWFNPLSWVILLSIALAIGIYEGAKVGLTVVIDTLKDAAQPLDLTEKPPK